MYPQRKLCFFCSFSSSKVDLLQVDLYLLARGVSLFLAAKRPTASDEVARGPAPYEIRRRTVLKVYVQGIWEIFACGIWNPRLWNPEYSSRIPKAANDCSNDKEAGIRYLESGIRNPRRRIQRLSWIPLHGAIFWYLTGDTLVLSSKVSRVTRVRFPREKYNFSCSCSFYKVFFMSSCAVLILLAFFKVKKPSKINALKQRWQ